MVAGVITPRRGIEIHPALVVGGHLHFGGITIVRIGAALKILRRVIVVRIIDVGIMVVPLQILRIVGIGPLLSVALLGKNFRRRKRHAQGSDTQAGKQNTTEHDGPSDKKMKGRLTEAPALRAKSLELFYISLMKLKIIIWLRPIDGTKTSSVLIVSWLALT